jgi:hypothetical protein
MEIPNNPEIIPERCTIFATGVFLRAIEVEIYGQKQWRWVAVGFEDDSYFDGEVINVYDYADDFDGLMIPDEE